MDKNAGKNGLRRNGGFFRGVAETLAEAVEIGIRYDTKRDFGGPHEETRREYRQRFGQDEGPEGEIPSMFSYVWNWFWKLSRRRGSSAAGTPNPLSCDEIRGWSDLLKVGIQSVEIEIILAMDEKFLEASIDEHDKVRQMKKDREEAAPKAKRFKG